MLTAMSVWTTIVPGRMSFIFSRKMKPNSAKLMNPNSAKSRIMDQVSCKLHQLLFLVLLSVIDVPKGYATNRNSPIPRDDAKGIDLENGRPETIPSLWNRRPEGTFSSSNRRPDPSKTAFPDWLASLTRLPSLEECGNSKVNLTDKIVGGYPAELGAWPWMAVFGIKDWNSGLVKRWGCGGTIISKRHILTAAHCFDALSLYNVVRLGELNLNPNVTDGASPVDYKIAEKIIHPGGSVGVLMPFHDIAIIRLESDIILTDLIQPICLPFNPEIRNNTWVGYSPYLAGWGYTKEGGNRSDALLQVQVPVWDIEKCKAAYTLPNGEVVGQIDDRNICAGLEEGGKDSCQGDSGGPMMISHNSKIYQIGIVSWGVGCAEPKVPGVYARVSPYLEWIAKNTKEFS